VPQVSTSIARSWSGHGSGAHGIHKSGQLIGGDRTRRQRHQHCLNLHIGQLVLRVFQNCLHHRASLLAAQGRVLFVQNRQRLDQVWH
jgi:hypothetical protein